MEGSERKNFKAGALLAPLPAVLVTVGNASEKNVLTVAWCGILSTDPPRAYVSVRPSRHSHRYLKEGGEFVINLTSEKLALAADYAGIYTGAKLDKFAACALTALPSKCVAPPTIAESPLALECRVFNVIESGTHDIFMADVLNVSCDPALVDSAGRICYERAGLIAYAHGEYYALGRKIGKFGFSTDKANRAHVAERKAPPVQKIPKRSAPPKQGAPTSQKPPKRKDGSQWTKARKK